MKKSAKSFVAPKKQKISKTIGSAQSVEFSTTSSSTSTARKCGSSTTTKKLTHLVGRLKVLRSKMVREPRGTRRLLDIHMRPMAMTITLVFLPKRREYCCQQKSQTLTFQTKPSRSTVKTRVTTSLSTQLRPTLCSMNVTALYRFSGANFTRLFFQPSSCCQKTSTFFTTRMMKNSHAWLNTKNSRITSRRRL